MKKHIISTSIIFIFLVHISYGQMLSTFEQLNVDTEILEFYTQRAKPTFQIILNGKEHYEKLGNSRIGGYPDLPEDVEYPMIRTNTSKGNFHYNFIAQINLAEVGGKIHPEMPDEGILYFFIHNDDESMSEVKHLVFYWNGDQKKLKRFSPPKDMKFTGEQYTKPFPAYSISFKKEMSIDLHHLEDNHNEYLQENQRIYEVFDRTTRLGGHNYSVDGYIPPRIIYQLNQLSYDERHLLYRGYLTGKKSFLEDSKNSIEECLKKVETEKSPILKNFYQSKIREVHRQRALEKQTKGQEKIYQKMLDDWILLLAVDSIDECEMLWWDSSILEYYINLEDLKNKDFSNTFCLINH